MTTERALRRQVRAATGETVGDHIQRYDIPATVHAIQDRYGLVDIDTIDHGEFQQIVAEHDIRQEVIVGAARLLQEARDCLAADRPEDRDGRLALADRFRAAMSSGLGDLGVLHMTAEAGPDENLDTIMSQWATSWAAVDPERAKAREALARLFAKLEERIRSAA